MIIAHLSRSCKFSRDLLKYTQLRALRPDIHGGTAMSIEKVRAYFHTLGIADRIQEFDVSSATVELAAQALRTEPGRIAKAWTARASQRRFRFCWTTAAS